MKKYLFCVSLFLFLFSFIYAQQRDSRVRDYLSPVRVVWQQNGEQIQGANNLLLEGNGQTDFVNKNICRMISTEHDRPAILLDFGKELQGGLQIVTGMCASHKPIHVRIRFGESVSESMCEIDGINGATNDHTLRDFVVTLPWAGVFEVGNTGFRFVRIDLLDESTTLHLEEVRAISVYRDLPYRGTFQCSDQLLNKIWMTGAYTVHLNMQNYLWDGIKRDRLVWIGDMYPEVMTINTVFGYNEVVPKSLDLVRDMSALPAWMNGISAYSIWWLLIQYEWFCYQGDLSYLKEQKQYMCDLLRLLLSKIDEKGCENLNGFRFLDWPSSGNKPAVNAGLHALMVWAMQYGAKLCDILEESQLADDCRKASDRMIAAADTVIVPFEKQNVSPDTPGMKQAAALMSLAGMIDKNQANDKYLAFNGAKGFSTFYGFYMLEAMAMAGNYQGAIDIIREYWGAMIALGATTFWEDFNIDWVPEAAPIDNLVPEGKKDIHGDFGAHCYKGFRHSLCHGWASAPTYWLSKYVLGIYPIDPGCQTVTIRPNLRDLEWAEGTFPTPYGDIKVRHERGQNGEIKSDIKVPEGIKIVR